MRILVILSRFPYPLEKGDKLRAYYQIRELAKENEIILFALSDEPVTPEQKAHLVPYCAQIHIQHLKKPGIARNLGRALFKGWPFQVGYFYHPAFQKKLDAIVAREKPQAIYAQLIRTTEYVRNYAGVRKTLDYMDVFSAGMKRRLETESFFKKIAVRWEYKRLLRYEQEIFDDFEEKVIISRQDGDLIPHPKNAQIAVIPNGVDYEFFQPQAAEKKYDLLFAGNMGYPPNIESVGFIAKEVMPLLHKARPQANFVIAGASPAPEVKALEGPHIEVTGWVDDIRDYFAGARIMLAPMLISIGMQNKILQAMAMKIPCIVTTLANNAIGAPVGECIIEANTPQEYVEAIENLLSNPEKAHQMAENAYQFVTQTYNWEVTGKQLNAIIQGK